jgi:hypothetical protein
MIRYIEVIITMGYPILEALRKTPGEGLCPFMAGAGFNLVCIFRDDNIESQKIGCLGGGTGRRKGLKIPRALCLYEFDSRPGHH